MQCLVLAKVLERKGYEAMTPLGYAPLGQDQEVEDDPILLKMYLGNVGQTIPHKSESEQLHP